MVEEENEGLSGFDERGVIETPLGVECPEKTFVNTLNRTTFGGQQLFSFRYNKWKVLWRICHLSLAIFITYKIVFDWALKKNIFMFFFSELVMGLVLVSAIFLLLDVLLTHEIILFREKIIKTWRIGLKREVEFVDARLGGMKTPFCSTKRFYPYWINNFFTPIFGVFYDETLAANKDVRRMNEFLAEISGREFSLFASEGMFATSKLSLKSFLREGKVDE